MTEEGSTESIARLRQVMHDLEHQVACTPEQARDAVTATLSGGIGYVVHVVSRLTDDVKQTTRREGIQETDAMN